jgi:hypothetical protein
MTEAFEWAEFAHCEALFGADLNRSTWVSFLLEADVPG